MNSRERMLTAMTRGIPDRVPASPDTNWMIPARMAGGPYWKVYYYNDPPIWKAYNDCVRHFGVDGFSHHGVYSLPSHPDVFGESRIICQDGEKLVIEDVFRCPAGELTSETTFLRELPPTNTRKYITDFDSQFEIVKYFFMGDVEKINFDAYEKARTDMGDSGVVGLCMNLPTLLTHLREPMESAFLDYYDYHSKLTEIIGLWTDQLVKIAHKIVERDVQPDFVFFPNSGMITLQSVDIMKEFSLPALKRLTKIFKDAGIVTSLHCCGKERELVELAATETDLDCIDPLEVPPMGNCDLKEIKEKFGRRLALKGNLHTTDVMLRMDASGVEREARKCLDVAMDGGGFILSTGDQCGPGTPDENIFKLVEVCERYGKY